MSNRRLNKQGREAYRLVERMLSARRRNDLKKEQEAYENLRSWCDSRDADIGAVIADVEEHMKSSVACRLNGLI